jgi:hypothetical protein
MVVGPPDSTKNSLRQRLNAHAQAHWPQVANLDMRYRGEFTHVEATFPTEPSSR